MTENTLQHADDQSSLAGEGCDGDGVCLCRSTAVTIFTAQPVASHNLLVFTCTLSTGRLVVERQEAEHWNLPHFFPGTKRLFVDDMR